MTPQRAPVRARAPSMASRRDGVEVEARVDAEDGRAQPGDALAQRLVLSSNLAGARQWPPPVRSRRTTGPGCSRTSEPVSPPRPGSKPRQAEKARASTSIFFGISRQNAPFRAQSSPGFHRNRVVSAVDAAGTGRIALLLRLLHTVRRDGTVNRFEILVSGRRRYLDRESAVVNDRVAARPTSLMRRSSSIIGMASTLLALCLRAAAAQGPAAGDAGAGDTHAALFSETRFPSAATWRALSRRHLPRVVRFRPRLRAAQPRPQRHAGEDQPADQRDDRRLLRPLPHAGGDEPRRADVHVDPRPAPGLSRRGDLRRLSPAGSGPRQGQRTAAAGRREPVRPGVRPERGTTSCGGRSRRAI